MTAALLAASCVGTDSGVQRDVPPADAAGETEIAAPDFTRVEDPGARQELVAEAPLDTPSPETGPDQDVQDEAVAVETDGQPDACPDGCCPAACGDGVCDPACAEAAPGEAFCPQDCCQCGDGICNEAGCAEGWKEGLWTCAPDCTVCGNSVCEPGEGPDLCPVDCCGTCGDGLCRGGPCAETGQTCPEDCVSQWCPDGSCDPGENPVDCPQDCMPFTCPNGACEPGEGTDACPEDCTKDCGNCDCAAGESYGTCVVDCGFCGDGYCVSECSYIPEDGYSCPEDCCTPACDGKECGADGCGGSCGACGPDQACDALGKCIGCEPDCAYKECGTDGCGGSCGECPDNTVCLADGTCLCIPQCGDKMCGPDGCGSECGKCVPPFVCAAEVCVCQADCAGKTCGPDGCGGDCGQCLPGQLCMADGTCKCVPDCAGKECGSDGCGGTCGQCAAPYACEGSSCICHPACGERVCGPDGCGGECGQCLPDEVCLFTGTCLPIPQVACETDANCAWLEDGDLCNGKAACKLGVCAVDPLSVVKCDGAGDTECAKEQCDPENGQCAPVPLEDGTPCDDQDVCSEESECQDGECMATVPAECTDGNPCTLDVCVPFEGCLSSPAVEGPCDDGSLCTENDACLDGECHGQLKVCDDGNICTDNACDPVEGCLFTDNAAPCDDSDECTAGDTCALGTCVPGGNLDCGDGEQCTVDSCDPLTGCSHLATEGPCDDGNKCTLGDKCTDGVCLGAAPLDCDDGNDCTADSCVPMQGCVHAPDSGVCDDDNPCTDDACDPAQGCIYSPNAKSCDDGDHCTSGDKCFVGACKSGAQVNCNDGIFCTEDTCDPAVGCVYAPTTKPCNDGNACTDNDVCSMNKCGGTPKSCDDQNVCTDDTCNPASGCVNTPNVKPCEDGNKCTDGDKCSGGSCIPGGPLNCDDDSPCTADTCYPMGGCAYAPVQGSCDDKNPCTTPDTCMAGKCVGTPIVCTDGNFCTDDTCDPVQGCVFAENAKPCDDADKCTENDTCGKGSCKGTPRTCDDANVCTDDLCSKEAAGDGCLHTYNMLECEDGNPCTKPDRCVTGWCYPGPPSACNDANPCTTDVCLPAGDCVHTPNADLCFDGDWCTDGDYCQDGVCQPGSIDLCPDQQCTAEIPLDCAGSDSWGTSEFGATDVVDDYSVCTSGVYDGPEYAYFFHPEIDRIVTVTLTQETGETDVFVVEDTGKGCDPLGCVTWGSASVQFAAQAGKMYYIIVDAQLGANGLYTIGMSCL